MIVEMMLPLDQALFGEPLKGLVSRLGYMRRLERTWQLIETDYDDSSLGLEIAAKRIGVSKNHLNVLLHGVTSLTFHQLLTRYRIMMAISMIKSRNHSILEIALANGFGSLNTFERNFRTFLGVTPIEFKKFCLMSRTSVDAPWEQVNNSRTTNLLEEIPGHEDP